MKIGLFGNTGNSTKKKWQHHKHLILLHCNTGNTGNTKNSIYKKEFKRMGRGEKTLPARIVFTCCQCCQCCHFITILIILYI